MWDTAAAADASTSELQNNTIHVSFLQYQMVMMMMMMSEYLPGTRFHGFKCLNKTKERGGLQGGNFLLPDTFNDWYCHMETSVFHS